MGDEKTMPDSDLTKATVQKILIWVLTAGLAGSLGWIMKLERHMTQVVADIEDIEDDVQDLESDIAEAKALSQKINDNRLDLTTVQGIVQNINDKVDDIKRALERIGPR
jgi:uncharacterized protein YdbL (DUF1318 family)